MHSTATTTADTTVHLDLGEFGSATAVVHHDFHTGRTRYQVTARNVCGSFTVTHRSTPARFELIPHEITLYYGAPSDEYTAHWKSHPDAPRVNGIEVVGRTGGITAEDVHTGRLFLDARRAINDVFTERVPHRTYRRLHAVVLALLRHWITDPQLPALRHAAAQYHAPGRIAELQNQADAVTGTIRKLTAERDTHHDQIRQLRTLTETDSDPAPRTREPYTVVYLRDEHTDECFVAAVFPGDLATVDTDTNSGALQRHCVSVLATDADEAEALAVADEPDE